MNFVTLPRIIKSGLQSFVRNGWLSVAASGIVSLTLVLISIFVILLMLGSVVVSNIKDRIDIAVFFNDTAKVDDIQTLKTQIEQQPNTKSVRYISKKEAFEIYKGRSETNRKLVESIPEEENPLPASLEIKANDTSKLSDFDSVLGSDFAKGLIQSRSDKDADNKLIYDRLQKIFDFIKKLGIFISLVVLTFSVLVVFNTIRITIFSRRREIEIMKLVGASNWYVRGPFIVEGVFYGLIGLVVAMLVVYLIVSLVGPSLTNFFENTVNVQTYFKQHFLTLLVVQLVTGIGVGVLSSMIAIRRHLRN